MKSTAEQAAPCHLQIEGAADDPSVIKPWVHQLLPRWLWAVLMVKDGLQSHELIYLGKSLPPSLILLNVGYGDPADFTGHAADK